MRRAATASAYCVSLLALRAGVGVEVQYVPGAAENVSKEYFRHEPGNGICERGVLLVFGNMVPQYK